MRRTPKVLLALAATSALALAACGDDDDAGSAATSSASDHGDGGHDEPSEVAEGAREIEVTGSSFEFDPDEITVTAGEDVAIVLTSTDVLHDFTIDELDAHVAAEADETASGGLRADEPGEYTYYCAVAGHRDAGMEGTLVVEAP